MSELALSPEQREVIDSWGRGMAVQAGAGTGKTTTLVLKCKELLRMKPDARFVAVSFTERSASDLRAKLSSSLSLEGHWVMTIHGLCGAILREFPREAGFDGEESMLSEPEAQILWERAVRQSLWTDAEQAPHAALGLLLARESRDSLGVLLKRARDLQSSGMIESLASGLTLGAEDPHSCALAELAAFVLERYERLKRRRGALDFNDLEKGADRALEHAWVREAFHRRFELVLVDEFQDTNSVQARVILRLVRGDLSNLCVVGDPKQSIYRFRDADVGVFSEFCSKLPVQVALTWNFRSRPAILELANHVCGKAFPSSGLEYQALVPKRPTATDGAPSVLKVAVKGPQDFARWIRSEQERGARLQDYALLLRKIRGNERWLKALTAAGIPIAVGSGGLFWEDPRTRELVAFLKWWDNPANTLSGAIFLRAPWIGVPDEDLDQWNREDPSWVKPFFASSHPIAHALAPFRGKIVRPGELLMALATRETENELGATLLGLWHRVEELSSRGLDFHSAVAELGIAVEERRRERDVPPPKNQGQLQVLTLHGAKGLEFPNVILLDLGKKGRAPNSPGLFWDRRKGAYLVRKDSDGERIEDETFSEWKKQEREKDVAESKRVFYVALTRARDRLTLVCPELQTAVSEDLSTVNPDEVYKQDFWRGWLEVSGVLASVTEAPEPAPHLARDSVLASLPDRSSTPSPRPPSVVPPEYRRPRHSVTEWNLLSRCPRAYEWTAIRPRAGAAGRPKEWDVLPHFEDRGELDPRDLGTEVHACLETGDLERLNALERRAGPERFRARVVREWAERSPWMNRSLGGFEEAFTELVFEVPVGGEVLVGSMDRVLVTGNSFTVIDFKVTRHEKSPEELIEAYGAQMEIYRWALSHLVGGSHPSARVSAHLVHFSDSSAREVEVPTSSDASVEALAELASRIVAGIPGEPRPGSLCKICRFRSECMPEI